MQKEKPEVDFKKLKEVIDKLDDMGYKYIDGFVSNKKDKVRAIHLKCGKERYTKFSLYNQKECRYCKRDLISNSNKFQKKITPDIKDQIIVLHSEGKTSTEIAKEIDFSASAVRNYFQKIKLKPNITQSSLKPVHCKVCNKIFMPKYHNRGNCCSKECVSQYISELKTKYNSEDIDRVKELKQQKLTNKDIVKETNVDINKVKEIVKDNGLQLSIEDVQKNSFRKKLEKNPNCMEEMRESRMKYPVDKFEDVLIEIKKRVETKKESATAIAGDYQLTGSSVTQCFHRRGWGDLLNKCSSTQEIEILEWVQQWYPSAHSTRSIISPKEIDIYIPELKLGIEYCGLYWHNEISGKERKYHKEKLDLCNEKGIRLIMIFEDEWLYREKQVKNFLKSVMNINEKRIYARKCEIREVDLKIARDFLEENHIQGKTTLKIAFGLYFEEELVGLVTGNCHHRKSEEFTLNRLVFADGIQVIGGASKLLKYLIKYAKDNKFHQIISWSDNRWSEGNVYEKVGFILDGDLPVDYSYYNSRSAVLERQSKQSNKKKNLINKGAEGTHEGNTERELALTLGLYRIWDCGKKRWIVKL